MNFNKLMKTAFFVYLVSTAGTLRAGTVTYDLAGQWANNSNPNGTWSFKQGITLLPYQSNFAPVVAAGLLCATCFTNGYAPSNVPGGFLPFIGKATGDAPLLSDFLAGDIIFHSVDCGNGSCASGEFHIDWAAPTAGTITISGDIWYAQSPLDRSNNFSLELVRGGSVIQTIESGTICPTTCVIGSSRNNQDPLSSGGSISVNAGDVIELVARRSAGQFNGSIDGINLTITETSGVPELATMALLGLGLAALAVLKRREVH
jgi:hypothetical protein